REQGTDDSALVTTARLQANCGDCERAQPYDQLGPAGCVVTYRKEPPFRQHHHIQAVLRDVDTAKREHGHLRIPSLLMRARALATVRVWKKRPEHQAHSRSDIETPAGFRSRRGLSYDDSAPVTPHNAPFPTYKTPRVHHVARRGSGRVAAYRTRPAAERHAALHLLRECISRRAGGTCTPRGVSRGVREARLGRRPQYSHRGTLGHA